MFCIIAVLWQKVSQHPTSQPYPCDRECLCGYMYLEENWLCFNSLGPGRFKFKFRLVIFKPILVNGGWGISYEIALRWMPQDLTDDKSTLVQVMASGQATSHYLSQCWPRSMSPYGVTRLQWVNGTALYAVFEFHLKKLLVLQLKCTENKHGVERKSCGTFRSFEKLSVLDWGTGIEFQTVTII